MAQNGKIGTVNVVWIRGPRGMRRQFFEVHKEAIGSTLDLWTDEYLPLHFEGRAWTRYQYQARSKDYNRGKRKDVGHRRPLVYTGRSRDILLNPGNQRKKISRKDGTVRWTGLPKYFYQYKFTKRINDKSVSGNFRKGLTGRKQKKLVEYTTPRKAIEVTQTTKAERTALAKHYKNTFHEKINQVKESA